MNLKGQLRNKLRFLVLTPVILLNYGSFAQKTPVKEVSIMNYGIYPDEGKNTLPAVRKAILENKGAEKLILNFPKGRYDFYPDAGSNATQGFELFNKTNITIDGKGSSFIFHSKMSPFNIKGCDQISLKNFSIDWDRPYISQGQVVQVSDEYTDIRIDPQAYPFVIENGRILFKGEGWQLGVELYNLYDKDKKEIVYKTFDNPMGADFFKSRAEEVGDGVVRFYTKTAYKPVPGTYISMLHTRYLSTCIQLTESKNITLQHIDIFHSLSMGVAAFKSENIQLDDVNVTVNEKKGRVFSAVADGFHFSTCKGFLKITNCTNTGQADDFINIHGEYIPVKEGINAYTLVTEKKARLRDVKYLLSRNEEVWLIDRVTAQRSGPYVIKKIEPLLTGNEERGYQLRFDKKIPEGVNDQYYIENKTWTPDVEIRNCRILKKHRARGILVTTPGKVLIENNYFSTAGAAILMEGDMSFWFESGAVAHVIIRNNVFENCVTSGKYWGDAVITISPSFKPVDEASKAYHHGITIENNEFRHFDHSILFARSVQDLQFLNNKLIRTRDYLPFSPQFGFSLDGCRNVIIAGNVITGDFLGTEIKLEHMKEEDLFLDNAGLTRMP